MMEVMEGKCVAHFAGSRSDEHLRAELLAFWSRHPGDRFTVGVISYAIDHSKLELNKALKLLAEAGIVNASTHGDLIFYNLTADEAKRRSVLDLSVVGQDSLQSHR